MVTMREQRAAKKALKAKQQREMPPEKKISQLEEKNRSLRKELDAARKANAELRSYAVLVQGEAQRLYGSRTLIKDLLDLCSDIEFGKATPEQKMRVFQLGRYAIGGTSWITSHIQER